MGDKVVIVVESKNYEVSKAKLAEKSSYFNSMFNGDFLEKNESTVKLQGVNCEAWEEILFFLENGKLTPKTNSPQLHRELLNVLEATDMLQFTEIREKCLSTLIEILEPENCLEILEVARKLDMETLIKKSRALALWEFDAVTNSETFYNLNVDQAENYLIERGINSPAGEFGVWQAVDRWLNSGPDFKISRNEHLPRLIKCVCLKQLTLSDLRTISLNSAVKSCEIVYSSILRLIEERSRRAGRRSAEERGEADSSEDSREAEIVEFIRSWNIVPLRKLPLVPAVVAKLSKDSGVSSPYIVRYSAEEKKFVPFLRLDEVESNLSALVGFKVISHESKLYMLGGEIMTRQVSWYLAVWQYDQIFGKWKFIANLRKEVRHASVCIVGDYLYVIGGFGRHRLIQETVTKLSLTNRTWTMCASLPRPMYSVPCCVFKGKIYAIQNQIYQYTPERDSWAILDIPLPHGEVFSNAVANDDYIFVSGLRKCIYRFDPTVANIRLEEIGKFQWECTQSCLIDNYIYSVSQIDFDYELYCERYDMRTRRTVTLWKGVAGNEIETFSPNHHHGCFPVLLY